MEVSAIIEVLDIASVALIVGVVGLQSRLGTGLSFVRANPGGVASSMLAMFVAVPAFVLLLTWLLPLERPVALALLALSVSPMPPILPTMKQEVGCTSDYISATLFMAPLLALVAIPALVWIGGGLFGRAVSHDPVAVVQVLVVTIGAPLLIGLLINHYAPDLAAKLAQPASWLGSGLLAIVAVAMLFISFPAVRNAIGNGTLLVIVAVAAFGLLAGHLAGGPHPGNRRALALICSQRHPGVAMAITLAAFPEEAQATFGAVLVYVLASSAVGYPYSRWRPRTEESHA